MANQYETGVLTAVWYQVGLRDGDEPKLKRANFDVLTWAPVAGGMVETFIVPLGFTRVAPNDLNDVAADGVELIEVGQEFGYYSKKSYIIEQHEADGSDNLFGLNSFGYL